MNHEEKKNVSEPDPAGVHRIAKLVHKNFFFQLAWHILIFATLIGSLSGIHQLLLISRLPVQQMELINKFHFYSYLILMVIFAVGFIIRVLLRELSEIEW